MAWQEMAVCACLPQHRHVGRQRCTGPVSAGRCLSRKCSNFAKLVLAFETARGPKLCRARASHGSTFMSKQQVHPYSTVSCSACHDFRCFADSSSLVANKMTCLIHAAFSLLQFSVVLSELVDESRPLDLYRMSSRRLHGTFHVMIH